MIPETPPVSSQESDVSTKLAHNKDKEFKKADPESDDEADSPPKDKPAIKIVYPRKWNRSKSKSRSRSRSKSIEKMKQVPEAFLSPIPFQYSQSALKAIDVLEIAKESNLHNILFYSNEVKITFRNFLLGQIQTKLRKNFDWMEDSHDYIQWLFPNHYRSRFNYSSHALSYQ